MGSRHEISVARAQASTERLDHLTHTQPKAGDAFPTVVTKIRQAYAFYPELGQAFPLYADSIDAGISIVPLRQMMMPWVLKERGPMGGMRKVNPVDAWLSDPRRIVVAGLQLRPDKPAPTFEEGGRLWLNTYSPPLHNGRDGSPLMGIEFLKRLLPDRSEHEYFLCWLAHKVQHPEVPGPAVIMVARQHGTGRGTLAEILKGVVGRAYVRSIPFHIFAGKTYQSQYNDWGANSLLVFVNESSDSGSHPFATKRDTYEHLKDLVEPRSIERTYVTKGRNAFTAPSFTAYLIATNHADALPLPENDRRFAVLQNGEPSPREFWEALASWSAVPANIASFAHWLERYPTGDYSPYVTPPMTAAKLAMAELATSELDRLYSEALVELPGKIVTPHQVVDTMHSIAARTGSQKNQPKQRPSKAKRMVQSRLHRVGVRHGPNWMIQITKVKHPIYSRTKRDADRWTREGTEQVRQEVMGNLGDGTGE